MHRLKDDTEEAEIIREWDDINKTMNYLAYKQGMKSTGVKSTNGNIIYEGDIIKHHFEKSYGIVKFGKYENFFDDGHGGHIGFYVDWQDEYNKKVTRKDMLYWAKIGEVVGNIFENPEYLIDCNKV